MSYLLCCRLATSMQIAVSVLSPSSSSSCLTCYVAVWPPLCKLPCLFCRHHHHHHVLPVMLPSGHLYANCRVCFVAIIIIIMSYLLCCRLATSMQIAVSV